MIGGGDDDDSDGDIVVLVVFVLVFLPYFALIKKGNYEDILNVIEKIETFYMVQVVKNGQSKIW